MAAIHRACILSQPLPHKHTQRLQKRLTDISIQATLILVLPPGLSFIFLTLHTRTHSDGVLTLKACSSVRKIAQSKKNPEKQKRRQTTSSCSLLPLLSVSLLGICPPRFTAFYINPSACDSLPTPGFVYFGLIRRFDFWFPVHPLVSSSIVVLRCRHPRLERISLSSPHPQHPSTAHAGSPACQPAPNPSAIILPTISQSSTLTRHK
ncbi:hypothetical protein PtA15_3A918 [Puccinia triticina]|uniref:Uncharacterized protein n=1 Tax=Puccinia triticina TaxID=208348 RepID=A0ABY7CL56_9BASI|nr:uncharacterized protein PtA15_3A918 [Puccinia triticina]WAQ83547.1 hypothetical protein PtA15_3A918 [Puccinia triticina]WAR54378.1 hypothetical protein PtB15_3B892 [Puccinia triticina]